MISDTACQMYLPQELVGLCFLSSIVLEVSESVAMWVWGECCIVLKDVWEAAKRAPLK